MFCNHCGASNPDGSRFCSTCGDTVTAASLGGAPNLQETELGLPKDSILANRYKILSTLGLGGMGRVYLAEDQKLGIKVAIKVLREILALDPGAMKRLIAEARCSIQLAHPNIVRVNHFEDSELVRFLVMEYVDGETLAHRIAREGKLPEDKVRGIAIETCKGLEHAHEKKVIHRDIKPGNILLGKDGSVKIADFGIARECRDSMSRLTSKVDSGTLLYMSPEQLEGESGESSDLYSTGVMLYEMLCGNLPFRSGDIVGQIKTKAPKPLDAVSPQMNAVVMRCLEKKPHDRFASAKELREALAGSAENRGTVPCHGMEEREQAALEAEREKKAREEREKAETERRAKAAEKRAVRRKAAADRREREKEEAARKAREVAETLRRVQEKTQAELRTRPPAITIESVNRIQLWHALKGHAGRVIGVAFTPDGKIVASSGADQTVLIWRVADGALLFTLSRKSSNFAYGNTIAISPDGTMLAVGSAEGALALWSIPIADGANSRKLEGHSKSIDCLAFSPDGKMLATGSSDCTVRVWQPSDGRLLRTLEWGVFSSFDVLAVAFSGDGSTLVGVNKFGDARLWLAEDGSVIRKFKQQLNSQGLLDRTAINADRVLMNQAGAGRVVRLWGASDEVVQHVLKGHSGKVLARSLVLSPDRTLIASGSYDLTIKMWRAADGVLLHTLQGHTKQVNCVAFSPDGTVLASGSGAETGKEDNTVRLWRVK
jgi:eukaryotic-like serine/threonine-protein kinase